MPSPGAPYHLTVAPRTPGPKRADGIAALLAETSRLVGELLRENQALRARNQVLEREVTRLSAGWDTIKRIARSAPRTSRPR